MALSSPTSFSILHDFLSLALPSKSKHPINETEQHDEVLISDEISSEYTRTMSDFVHSKRRIVFIFINIKKQETKANH